MSFKFKLWSLFTFSFFVTFSVISFANEQLINEIRLKVEEGKYENALKLLQDINYDKYPEAFTLNGMIHDKVLHLHPNNRDYLGNKFNDIHKARALYKQGCQYHQIDACYLNARTYDVSDSFLQDLSQANYYYNLTNKLLEQKEHLSCYNLYLKREVKLQKVKITRVVEKDLLICLEKHSLEGKRFFQFLYANLLKRTRFVEPDKPLAFAWYYIAAQNGYALANFHVKHLAEGLSDIEEEQAVKYTNELVVYFSKRNGK